KQINNDARNILGLQLPALALFGFVSAKVRVNRAGHDVAHLYAVMPDLLHQSFAETVEAEFRGVIDGHLRVRVRARERRDVYDVASAAPFHLRNCLAAAIEDAEQICLNNSAEIFWLCFIHAPEDSYASVVD